MAIALIHIVLVHLSHCSATLLSCMKASVFIVFLQTVHITSSSMFCRTPRHLIQKQKVPLRLCMRHRLYCDSHESPFRAILDTQGKSGDIQ